MSEAKNNVKGKVQMFFKDKRHFDISRISLRVAMGILVFFAFLALFAPLLASPFPWLVYNNQSGQELPLSPLLKSFVKKGGELDYRTLSRENKIGAIFAPVPYSPYEQNLDEILLGPSAGWGDNKFGHWMGTDEVGRDITARMIHGARNSLLVGLVAVSISIFFGILIGSTAGYFGGWIDLLLSRFTEIVITFPTFILILAVLALLKPSLTNVMIVIGLTGWTSVARVVRAEFLKRKNAEFVSAAKAMGASHFRLIFIHILPASMPPVIVMTSFATAGVVLTESALSFLGIGIQPPEPSWGQILNSSKAYIDFAWWQTVFPGFFIFLTVVAFNLLGDYLRKKILPRG